VTLDELASQRSIGFSGGSTRSVFQNRFPKAGRLAQAYTTRDHGLINPFAKMFPHIGNYLLAKVGPPVEHRHNDPAELETLVRA